MFYVVFLTIALLFITKSIFTTYTFTKQDSENAATANAILNNVDHVEKSLKLEQKLGNHLHSIYELNLPISNYMVNDNNNIDDITFLNILHDKSYIYMKEHPFKTPNCIDLNNAKLLTKSEFDKCLSIEKKEYNWIEDGPNGIKYNVTNTDISEKLNLTNKVDSNKIITDNNYIFNNNSNTVVRSDDINKLLNTLEVEKKNENYIKVIKIIKKIKTESPGKSIELLNDTLNNTAYFNFSDYKNDEILKNILYIILNNDGKIIINNDDKYKNIISYLEKNSDRINDVLNKTLFYEQSDSISTDIKTKLLGETK